MRRKANQLLHESTERDKCVTAFYGTLDFRNGALNPNAFRRKPISEEDIMASPVLNYPLRQFMFCAPALPITGGVGSPVNPYAVK